MRKRSNAGTVAGVLVVLVMCKCGIAINPKHSLNTENIGFKL